MVDEGDTDIATFFHYMGLAAKRANPLKRKHLPLFNQEYLQSIPTFSKRYFENLYSRLIPPRINQSRSSVTPKKHRGKDFIIVLDNYQQIPPESLFHEVIREGLSIIPEKINIIVISRESPPPQLVRLQANSKMCFLGWDEIRFTLDESKKIAKIKRWSRLTDEMLLQLHNKTDGWAAGLVLIMEASKIKNIDYRLLKKLLPEEIFYYFAGEIFDRTDRDTQDFLLKTAFLPWITRHMSEELTGNPHAHLILSSLYQKNYFIQRYTHHSEAYQYHPLFRDFLLAKAKKIFNPEHVSKIKHDAAVILKAHDQNDDAIGLFREIEEWIEVARLISKQAPAAAALGRLQTLEAWIGALPATIVEQNPWLLYWTGICRMQINPIESLKNFEKAFELFKIQKDATGIFLAWSGAVESIIYSYEGLKPLDRWFSIIEDLLSEFKEFPSEEIEARVTCIMLRGLAFRQPHYPSMESWLDRARKIARTSSNSKLKIDCLITRACYWYSGVELQELENTLNSLRELLRNQDISPLPRLIMTWLEAANANLTSTYDHCLKVVSYGLELANTSGFHVMDYTLMGYGALSSLKTGNFATAKKYLQKMASSLNLERAWGASYYHYVAAWEALYSKNPGQASLHSEQCLKLCEDMGNPWSLSLAHLQRAFVCYAIGGDEKPSYHIDIAYLIGTQTKNEFTQFACLLTKAYFFIQKGEELSTLKSLREGMKIGHEKGFVNLYMWLPGVMESISAKALDAGIEVSYVQDLIKRNSFLPEGVPLETENWPWPLKIFTLGRFDIVKDGKPILFSGKVQQKPFSLLKAVIALGGRNVSELKINDVLWPEADGDAAHTSFSTTLYRLRQLLGCENSVHVQEGKITLDSRYCWVDAWAFERLLTQADVLYNKGKPEKAVELMHKAISMYHGHFLEEQPWAISLRELLRNRFIQSIKKLGSYQENLGQWEQAISCYQKGLEVDDLAEEFYQRLMICYSHLNSRSQVFNVYKRCNKTISAILGIEPSPETRSIYESLISPRQKT
jgi:ATP/maltotriose-dependent transcriptional regulator MalT/DNA-binding SARP family transcriptional activator